MKKTLLFLLSLLTLNISAKRVSSEDAFNAAHNFLDRISVINLKSSKLYNIKPVDLSPFINSTKTKSTKISQSYYVYDINEGEGFIIMSGNNLAKPILGFSMHTSIDPNNLPDAFIELLGQYDNEIEIASQQNSRSELNEKQWEDLLSGSVSSKSTYVYSDIPPLITTKWSQSPYYNKLCPENNEGQRAITGCVATSMAQVMKYHNFPAKGQSFYDYIANNFGQQSIIFANQTYKWSDMPVNLNGSSTNAEIESVAKLMYNCGVSVSMNYGVGASGSTMNRLANALRNYFSYNPDMKILHMYNYSASDWIDSIYTELQNGRPVLYAGFGNSSGHAFIIDGYEYNDGDKFHINWGWGGLNDGYFELTALNPAAYPAGFNYYQHGIFGVEPGNNYEEWNLILNQAIQFSSDTLYTNSPYSITFNAVNSGENDFTGDIAAFLFDKDSSMIQYSGFQWNKTIIPGDSIGAGISFNNSYLNVPAGDYLLGIFYKNEFNNWVPFKGGNFRNFKEITVIESDSVSSFILADSIGLNPLTPVQYDSLTIEISVVNRSGISFMGKLKAKLYDTWGNFLSEMDSTEYLEIKADSIVALNLNIDSVQLTPGKYYLSLFECPDGIINEYRINPDTFSNPVSLIVLPVPPIGDRYENNDSIEIAHKLDVEMSTNFFYKSYDSLSIHTDNDIDFFKIGMPQGSFVYNVNIYTSSSFRRDKEGTNVQQDYDGSLTLQYFDGHAWSEPFTQQTQSAVTMYPGDTLWIKLFPFFTGLTTDYSMSIYISRTVSTDFQKNNSEFNVFPSLFDNVLFFSSPSEIENIVVYNTNGICIFNGKPDLNSINTYNWSRGVYIIKTSLNNGNQDISTVVKQ